MVCNCAFGNEMHRFHWAALADMGLSGVRRKAYDRAYITLQTKSDHPLTVSVVLTFVSKQRDILPGACH